MPGNSCATFRHAVIEAFILLGLWLAPANPVHAQVGSIIIVTTTSETPGATGCRLRDAIIAANTDAAVGNCSAGTGNDAIYFQLGSGNPQINIGDVPAPFSGTRLPAITAPVTIDGAMGGATRVVLHGPGVASGVGPGLQINATASGTVIRNLVINNFGGIGIVVNASNVTIAGNFIGTDPTGTAAVANAQVGMDVEGAAAVIGGGNGTTPGGVCTGDCNLISGNGYTGINVSGSGTQVQGNYIGTNAAGDAALSNGGYGGILVGNTTSVTVGGSIPAVRNLISGNFGTSILGAGYGVWLFGSTYVTVAGNFIGTAANGSDPIPNRSNGVYVSSSGNAPASHNVIGGSYPGAGNLIAFNNGDGVRVEDPIELSNTIRLNSIHDNGQGINNVNGGNGELPPPIISRADTLIAGLACYNCLVDVYADAGNEGKTFLGGTTANGAEWVLATPATGPHITATETDADLNTSEFSTPFACADFNGNGLCDGVDDTDGDGVVDALDDCITVPNANQRDTDLDHYGNACDGDFNNDEIVNFSDLALFRQRFGTTNVDADFNGDGIVNFSDLAIFRSLFGKPPGPAGAQVGQNDGCQ